LINTLISLTFFWRNSL